MGTQIAASVLSALGGTVPSDGVIAAPPRSPEELLQFYSELEFIFRRAPGGAPRLYGCVPTRTTARTQLVSTVRHRRSV